MSWLTNIDPMYVQIFLLEISANNEQTDKKIVKIWWEFIDLLKER